MREVKPTQKPVPSSDIKDLFFNSGLLDIWATSLERKYIDRFGNCHLTAAGMEWIFNELVTKFKIESEQALLAAGYAPSGTFQEGAEVVSRNGTVLWKLPDGDGDYYRWDGDLPKQVPAGSTPQSTGGIGKGAWVSVGDASLRGEIYSNDGRKYIGKCKTIAELRSTEPDFDKQWIDAEKYHDDSDYPQGSYWFDASDSTTEDNGGTVIVTAGGNRWKFIGTPSVETYGAYADGIHDDSDAIINCAKNERIVNFYSAQYLTTKSFQFEKQNQEFHIGKGTMIYRKLLNAEMHGHIIDITAKYKEHCKVYGGIFGAHSSNIGKVTAIHSPADNYIAAALFEGSTFEKSLRYGVDGNIILCEFNHCRFGTQGESSASYQHVRAIGEGLIGSALTSNANTFNFCRFMNASGVDYGFEAADGYKFIFNDCDVELNNSSKATFKSYGIYLFKFNSCWFERNAGKSLLECSMDTSGSLQGALVNVFDSCWIKLDRPNNECVVYSTTQNFNIAFKNCAGTGFANKSLFKVDGLSDNYLPYLVSFDGNRFVGFSMLSNNVTFNAEVTSVLMTIRNSAGATKAAITISGESASIRADGGMNFERLDGTTISVIRRNGGNGTEFIGFSPDGRQYVLKVPNGGGVATWSQV